MLSRTNMSNFIIVIQLDVPYTSWTNPASQRSDRCADNNQQIRARQLEQHIVIETSQTNNKIRLEGMMPLQLLCVISDVLSTLVKKTLIDSPIIAFATALDFVFFPWSRSTSIFDLESVNAVARNSVFCKQSRTINASPTAKTKDPIASQSQYCGKQLRGTTLLKSRLRKWHIRPRRKNLWSRVGTADLLNASR